MKALYVQGVGFFSPGHVGIESYLAGVADPALTKPAASLLTGPSRRRASLLTRMALDVFGQAAEAAGADVAQVPSVWGIVHGEICTAVDLMGMMNQAEGKLSPAKFHNSVYNTASGYASIATGNRAPSVTLTGGPELVGSVLIEAAGLLHEGATQVLVVVADEPHPAPFESAKPRTPLAAALCLSSEPEGAIACLADLRVEGCSREEVPEEFDGLYVAAALPLLARIERRKPGRISLDASPGDSPRFSCELRF